jgi:ATP-binding cassette subfamily A (ABC1) protein 1
MCVYGILKAVMFSRADLLGDRIGIMAEGELRCCGSSMFLKNRYGAGYNFTLVKEQTATGTAEFPSSPIISLVTEHIAKAKVLSDVGAEVSFQLPNADSAAFPAMIRALDKEKTELGVREYGIGLTTMEEVFIKVAASGGTDEQEEDKRVLRQLSNSRLRCDIFQAGHSLIFFNEITKSNFQTPSRNQICA